MRFRHELKHNISFADMTEARQRLRTVMRKDSHAGDDGIYCIRSLYFDNLNDKALREKIDGVNKREKFRIRYYNGDTAFIVLEKKSRLNGLCSKEALRLSEDEARMILTGDTDWMKTEPVRPLLFEMYVKMRSQGLRPKTIVDYKREAFVYPCGNVRVTLDYDIRTGILCTDFLNPKCVTVPAGVPAIIMEVKWDEFLPDIIRDAVQIRSRQQTAFSKYAVCRIYG